MEFKCFCDIMVGVRIVFYFSLFMLINYQKINVFGFYILLCFQLVIVFGNVIIIQKGFSDIIFNGLKILFVFFFDELEEQNYLEVKVEGGLKWVGGQGDILSGSIGVLFVWGSEWVWGIYE